MKKLLIVCLFFTPLAFAGGNGFSGAFSEITGFLSDLNTLLFTEVPSLAHRFWAWVIEWYVYATLYIKLQSFKLAWGVAHVILKDISVTPAIQSSLAALPPKLAGFLIETKFIDALNIVLHAYATRFVLRLF